MDQDGSGRYNHEGRCSFPAVETGSLCSTATHSHIGHSGDGFLICTLVGGTGWGMFLPLGRTHGMPFVNLAHPVCICMG